ncbi:hypothetical protein GCM10010510_31600 [Streptomyces anandii JCM 4720]|nr:hypothetical protein GCM10010510_31600 [Streptomyces anandii JCM 4720]
MPDPKADFQRCRPVATSTPYGIPGFLPTPAHTTSRTTSPDAGCRPDDAGRPRHAHNRMLLPQRPGRTIPHPENHPRASM